MSFWLCACTGALAAAKPFEAKVQADGAALGVASATLDVTVANGKAAWKITQGRFAPATLPEAKTLWDDAILAGSGSVPSSASITVKDFTVTVEQNTGVDISYRFRLTASLADGAVKDVAITQVK